MEKTERTKEIYLEPKFEAFKINFEGGFCKSPSGGGSEGTEDEPLFP